MKRKAGKNEIKVGDLVRLKDDGSIAVGVGLVLEKREDCTEIVDLLDEIRGGTSPDILEEIPDFLLFKPIYLVLWQGENIFPTDKPVWMFSTELQIVE